MLPLDNIIYLIWCSDIVEKKYYTIYFWNIRLSKIADFDIQFKIVAYKMLVQNVKKFLKY